jgi:tetratricopeptide (TPR) repeat protein
LLALPTEEDDAAMAVRATALEGAAWLVHDQHHFAEASALFAQSGRLRRALGQEERPAGQLISAALEARASGEYARATALLEDSMVQYRRLGNQESTADTDLGLSLSWGYRYTIFALVLREQGEYARATALCAECLALARELGDSEGIGIALLSLSDLARDQGAAERSRVYCEECLALFRELGNMWGLGFTLNNLAQAAYSDGDLAQAASHAEESTAIFRSQQAGPSVAEVLIALSRIREAQGATEVARAHLVEALRLAEPAGPRVFMAAALEELGAQDVQQGHAQPGLHLLAAAAMLRHTMGTPTRPADRPRIERALVAARTALGASAYAGAWATGQAVPLEQVIIGALADPTA